MLEKENYNKNLFYNKNLIKKYSLNTYEIIKKISVLINQVIEAKTPRQGHRMKVLSSK